MIKLDYGASNIMLWKIHEKNTVLWEMAGMEEIAEIIAIFDTLNFCTSESNQFIFDDQAMNEWIDELGVYRQTRLNYFNGSFKKYRPLMLAVAACSFTPEDVMVDIIRNADDVLLDHILAYNSMKSQRVHECLRKQLSRLHRM